MDRFGNLFSKWSCSQRTHHYIVYMWVRILTGILCYALQKLRPCLLYPGRLQDRQGSAEGYPLSVNLLSLSNHCS